MLTPGRAAILGQAELPPLRTSDPAVHASLQIMQTGASDGAHVLRRLQGFARQRTTSPLAPVDLGTVVREAVELTRPRWHDEARVNRGSELASGGTNRWG